MILWALSSAAEINGWKCQKKKKSAKTLVGGTLDSLIIILRVVWSSLFLPETGCLSTRYQAMQWAIQLQLLVNLHPFALLFPFISSTLLTFSLLFPPHNNFSSCYFHRCASWRAGQELIKHMSTIARRRRVGIRNPLPIPPGDSKRRNPPDHHKRLSRGIRR